MTVSTQSPNKVTYAPAPAGDAYCKIGRDPTTLPPSLRCCPLGKWHNPDGQHFTLELAVDPPQDHPDHWYARTIRAGRLVEHKGGKIKRVDTPIARLAALGPAVLADMCKTRGITPKRLAQPPAVAKMLVAAGVTEAPKPPEPEPEPEPAAKKNPGAANPKPAPKDGDS